MFTGETEHAPFQKVLLTQYGHSSATMHVSKKFSDVLGGGPCYWGISNCVLEDSVIPLEWCGD